MYETIAEYLINHAGTHLALLVVTSTAITMLLPTKLDDTKKWHKYYNLVAVALNTVAGNVLRNKNKDHK